MKMTPLIVIGALMGALVAASGPAWAASGTTTYALTVNAAPTPAGVTLSETSAADTVTSNYQYTENVVDNTLEVTNSGGTSGTLYGEVGASPSGLTYSTSVSDTSAANTFEVVANATTTATTGLSGSYSTFTQTGLEPLYTSGIETTVAPGASTYVNLEFIISPNTSAGTYDIPVTFAIQ